MAESARLAAGEGDSVSLRGTEVTFKVNSDQAEGASCTEWVAAPGFDTGLHVHERLEETWYVLDGELEFHLGEETLNAVPGACVFVPPLAALRAKYDTQQLSSLVAGAEPRPAAR